MTTQHARSDAGAQPPRRIGLVRETDGSIAWTRSFKTKDGQETSTIRYKPTPDGTCYHAETPAEVVSALERARLAGKNVRLFYGDPSTGRDWLEENDVAGRLSRSMGPLKVPLLISPGRDGGDALLDHCVVRLLVANKEAYRHPGYHQPALESKPSPYAEAPYGVFADGKNQANFKTSRARDNYLAFIQGLPPPSKAQTSGFSR